MTTVTDRTPDASEILKISDLRVEFQLPRRQVLTAVSGIDLVLREGQTHGLIGESGSGKTVTALAALGLLDPPAVVTGELRWLGRKLNSHSEQEWRRIRGRGMAMLFQDAAASLNPALRIGTQLLAVIRLHQGLDRASAKVEALRLLKSVRMPDPTRVLDSYPHECSGGMAQRAALALALACRPRLLIADEPTSALDVTIAAQIIELLRTIRREIGLSMLIISHDLSVVNRLCDRVSVMYLGRIVEEGPTQSVLTTPLHPYTAALLDAATWQENLVQRSCAAGLGEAPSALKPPPGCRFHPRCRLAFKLCRQDEPSLDIRDTHGHRSACWLDNKSLLELRAPTSLG